MNKLRLAQHGFESLALALSTRLDEATSDRVEAWLRDEVCPVVTELARNRSFQLTTRWTVDRLSPGVETPERRLLETVDECLVRSAKELVSVLPTDSQSSEKCSFHLKKEISEEDRNVLELVASRPWFDLVCPEEFFHAYRDLHLNETNMSHTAAFRKRELRIPLGDYVLRSLLARVDYWKGLLDRLFITISSALPSGNQESYQAAERLFNRQLELDGAVQELKEVCHQEPLAHRREACVALTQVYTAYFPKPSLAWLGCPPDWGPVSAPEIRSCIRRQSSLQTLVRKAEGHLEVGETRPASLCDPETVRRIAAALEDVVVFYEAPEDPEDLIAWARNQCRLMLVDRLPREVYWDGSPIAGEVWDQYHVVWNLFWVLAQNPRRIIDQGMLQHPEKHQIRSRRERLSKILLEVQDLDALIETVRGHGYRLNLDAEDIHLLEDNGQGRLEFVGSR